MSLFSQLEFRYAVHQLGDMPPDTGAEVAFAGRSNAGKSTAINALANRKKLAFVSKTPGRTQAINFFDMGNHCSLVDLPGYGYAAGPKKESEAWREMIEGYLTGRKTLAMIFVLVDAEVGPTKLDHQMVEWLQAVGIPFRIVATKADQV